jgi:hypothetical protein
MCGKNSELPSLPSGLTRFEYAKPAKCDFLVGELVPQIVIVQREMQNVPGACHAGGMNFIFNFCTDNGLKFPVGVESTGDFLFQARETFFFNLGA